MRVPGAREQGGVARWLRGLRALWLALLVALTIGALGWLRGTEEAQGTEALAPEARRQGAQASASRNCASGHDDNVVREDALALEFEALQADPVVFRVEGLLCSGAKLGADYAQVWAWTRGTRLCIGCEHNQGFSDSVVSDDGAFELVLGGPGVYCVWAKSSTGPGSSVVNVELTTSSPAAFVELALRRPSHVCGQVVDELGQAVEGAGVAAFVDTSRMGIRAPDGLDSETYWGIRRGVTSSDGSFDLAGLDGGAPTLTLLVTMVEPSIGGAARIRQAELLDVLPGSEGIRITLHTENPSAASATLRLGGADVGPQAKLLVSICQVGVDGSVFERMSTALLRDDVGEYPMRHLIPGALYFVDYKDPFTLRHYYSSVFRAEASGAVSILDLPQTYPVGIVASGERVRVGEKGSIGVLSSEYSLRGLDIPPTRVPVQSWPVELRLVPGAYTVVYLDQDGEERSETFELASCPSRWVLGDV